MRGRSFSLFGGLAVLGCFGLRAEGPGPETNRSRLEELVFTNGKQELSGTLTLSAGTGPFPVVIFVHGDGAADRAGGGYYPQFFKAFSDAGIASFAWDKPGVGRSTNLFTGWKAQGYSDRMDEIRRAIACLKTRKEIDPVRIGLWGISQAAWIMPPVCAEMKPAFMIAVSCPGTTPAKQSAYLLACFLKSRGFTKARVQEAVDCYWAILAPWEKKLPYEDYLKRYREIADPHKSKKWFNAHPFLANPVDPEAYAALAGAISLDPLPALRKLECPVLAFFGEKDENIDAKADQALYEGALRESKSPDWKTVMVPGADHALMDGSLNREQIMARIRSEEPIVPVPVIDAAVGFAWRHFGLKGKR